MGEEGQTLDVCLQLEGVDGEEEVVIPFNVILSSNGGETCSFSLCRVVANQVCFSDS